MILIELVMHRVEAGEYWVGTCGLRAYRSQSAGCWKLDASSPVWPTEWWSRNNEEITAAEFPTLGAVRDYLTALDTVDPLPEPFDDAEVRRKLVFKGPGKYELHTSHGVCSCVRSEVTRAWDVLSEDQIQLGNYPNLWEACICLSHHLGISTER